MEERERHEGNFRKLFREAYPEMVKVALMYVRDLSVAEDIAQDSFARLWELQQTRDLPGNLRGYLMTSVKNSSLNHLKHLAVEEKFCREYLHEAEADEESPEEYLLLVRRLLEQLPPKRREVLELSIVESKSYLEIADLLGLSLNTVKDHIKKAYAFLREHARREIPSCVLYVAMMPKVSGRDLPVAGRLPNH